MVIPAVLKRKESIVFASQTGTYLRNLALKSQGTGKTLAYLLPVIQQLREDEIVHKIETRLNRPRAVILVPNRELGEQVLVLFRP